jgi:hypothetical protein
VPSGVPTDTDRSGAKILQGKERTPIHPNTLLPIGRGIRVSKRGFMELLSSLSEFTPAGNVPQEISIDSYDTVLDVFCKHRRGK